MFIVPITQMPSISSIEETLKVGQQSQATSSTSSSIPFAEVFKQALETMQETQAISEQDAYNLAMGKTDDLHTIMINAEKAATALEMTVQLTSRALSAYNEIMRMQI